mmetsp:Transcript_31068/g.95073  ORF Transcript_31068/g.95073 Transcript_31068/m.95073 type:complete len:219 (+) Transcript_31068:1895-2551(+)
MRLMRRMSVWLVLWLLLPCTLAVVVIDLLRLSPTMLRVLSVLILPLRLTLVVLRRRGLLPLGWRLLLIVGRWWPTLLMVWILGTSMERLMLLVGWYCWLRVARRRLLPMLLGSTVTILLRTGSVAARTAWRSVTTVVISYAWPPRTRRVGLIKLLRLADGAVHVLDRDHVQGDDNLSIVNHIADELLQLNDTVCLDLLGLHDVILCCGQHCLHEVAAI